MIVDGKRIARVFPRRTSATPTDEMAFDGPPPMLALPEIDEVHISVAFTYDLHRAEWLAKEWEAVGVPVSMGGPATGQRGEEFTPGMYLREGYTITSRGCPNRCWFCSVPRREGGLRELEVKEGWKVLDDNLLACSEEHIRKVFAMLDHQPQRPIFSGGLEARLLEPWHVGLLRAVSTHHMFFAYDTPDDYEPLVNAGKLLAAEGYTMASHALRTYVLIGYPGDTFDKAEKRLIDTMRAGFWPMAMLWKDDAGHEAIEWRRFQGQWARPAIIHVKLREGEIKL